MIITSNAHIPTIVGNDSRNTGQKFDALFLKELLTQSGIFQPPGEMSGGIGEQHFSSFMIDEYADILSQDLKLNLLGRSINET